MIMNDKVKFSEDVDVSDEVKDLILKMLVVEPSNRIGFEEFFKHPWVCNSDLNKEIDDKTKYLNCSLELKSKYKEDANKKAESLRTKNNSETKNLSMH
jgi:serine/threonine protein kinase